MKTNILIGRDPLIRKMIIELIKEDVVFSLVDDCKLNGNNHTTIIFSFTKIQNRKVIEQTILFRRIISIWL